VHGLKNCTVQVENCSFSDCRGNGVNFEFSGGFVRDCSFCAFNFPPLAVFGPTANPVLSRCRVSDCHTIAVIARDACTPIFEDIDIDDVDSHGFSVSDFSSSIVRTCLLSRVRGQAVAVFNGATARLFDNFIEVDERTPAFSVNTAGRLTLVRTRFMTEAADVIGVAVNYLGRFSVGDCRDNVVLRSDTCFVPVFDEKCGCFRLQEGAPDVAPAPIQYESEEWKPAPGDRRPPPPHQSHPRARPQSMVPFQRLEPPATPARATVPARAPPAVAAGPDARPPPARAAPFPVVRLGVAAGPPVRDGASAFPMLMFAGLDVEAPPFKPPATRPQRPIDVGDLFSTVIQKMPWEGGKPVCLFPVVDPVTGATRPCSKPATRLCSPCGHFVLCTDCAASAAEHKAARQAPDACPVCQTPIQASAERFVEETCCICLSAPPDTVILACGHQAVCYACSTRMWLEKRQCPMCQSRIISFRHQFPIIAEGPVRDGDE
jgi:hypothetical protein